MIDPRLTDRVALITGANNPLGIGAATARALAAQGVQVFLHGFTSGWKGGNPQTGPVDDAPGEAFYNAQGRKPVDETVAAIRAAGGRAAGAEADLSDPAAAAALFAAAERAFGPVEILVNNAAHWQGDSFVPADAELSNKKPELWTARPAPIDAEGFDRLMAVNTRAPALLMAELARRHIGRGADWGRIVNISTAGAHCFPSEVSYGAGKLALEGYTRSAALELARYGITVNAMSLGAVQTGWITPELEAEITAAMPLGRVGDPAEVADALVFLASDQARWITGHTLCVDGGSGV